MTDISDCIDSLLHVVHASDLDKANAQTSLLQYCGLRMLQQVGSQPGQGSSYNDACWSVRELVGGPAIRFVQRDPITEPTRPIPFTKTVLLVPNNTKLASSSTLVAQASKCHASDSTQPLPNAAAMGSIVRTRTAQSAYYDEVWHLVCRKPGQSKLVGIESALASILPGEQVLCVRTPLFGSTDDWGSWATGLRRLQDARKSIQSAAVFLELCFIPESLPAAEGIRAELTAKGVPFAWPDHV
jgi:hypothetical protein